MNKYIMTIEMAKCLMNNNIVGYKKLVKNQSKKLKVK